jgi:hypothetical protein
MEQLIKALQIFLKYKNETCPTNCVHDALLIMGITYDEVSEEDKKELETLHFYWSDEYDCWASGHFGSA